LINFSIFLKASLGWSSPDFMLFKLDSILA
jgi:hypothetical protein